MAAGSASRTGFHSRRSGRRGGGGCWSCDPHHPRRTHASCARARRRVRSCAWWTRRSGPGAQILDHCLLRECMVGAGAAGRSLRAHPPRHAHRGQGQVGNFVELKKTTLGDGSKVPHPLVHRRRHRGARREHRRRHHHLQLRRRPQAPDPHRGRGLHRQRHDRSSRRITDRCGRIHRRRQRHHPGRARGRPRPRPRPADHQARVGRPSLARDVQRSAPRGPSPPSRWRRRPTGRTDTRAMCGIVGYVGSRDASARHRARDCASWSTAATTPRASRVGATGRLNRRRVRRASSATSRTSLRDEPLAGAFGIGHTRWATHGRPSEENAHPHQDCTGTIVVVHNGIIENYLRAEAARSIAAGHTFITADRHRGRRAPRRSRYYEGDLEDAVRARCSELEGIYALVAPAQATSRRRLMAARNGPPLVVGLGESEHFLASDVPALLAYTRDFVFLDDGDVVVVTPRTARQAHRRRRARRSSGSPSASPGTPCRRRRAATATSCSRRSTSSRAPCATRCRAGSASKRARSISRSWAGRRQSSSGPSA